MSLNKYLSAFQEKKLCEVVIPGSHDAGIYDNRQVGGTALTQDLDIFQQAKAGVRWFDIRVAGQLNEHGKVETKAFHLALAGSPKQKETNLKYKKGGFGGFGGKLEDMLRDAMGFLEDNSSEFLIFKISKSQNIKSVYRICKDILGDSMYKADGDINLNTMKVSDFNKRVICLFSEDDVRIIKEQDKPREYFKELFAFRELFGKKGEHKAFESRYRGLQYFGKFSQTNYYGTNYKKQKKQMQQAMLGSTMSPSAMGMMYWTLTTAPINFLAWPVNIQNRNEKLWTDKHVRQLTSLFQDSLLQAIYSGMGVRSKSFTQTGVTHDWSGFMPNIIMLDFANDVRCQHIYNLNTIRNQVLDEYRKAMINVGF